jgi:hypothetical protein
MVNVDLGAGMVPAAAVPPPGPHFMSWTNEVIGHAAASGPLSGAPT